jgi:cell division protein FtsB
LPLVFQILLGVLVLGGLVAIFLSTKYWHWSLVTLTSFIFLFGILFLVLAADTMRIHRNLRMNLPRLEEQISQLEKQNHQLQRGLDQDLGIAQLEHQLRMVTRERGRAWRQVAPAGQLNQGRIEVTIPAPAPHGLAKDTIVYAFETGDANPNEPAGGRQYLGEFRVVETKETGAVLESVGILDQRTGERLARSQGPWSLYETMPVDRHKTFAGLEEADLRKLLPANVVDLHIRHGQEADANADPRNVVGLDENGKQLPPDEIDNAAKKVFQRPLVDYAYLFSELARQKVVLLARIDAVTEDNAKLTAALESAEKLSVFREDQIKLMKSDLAGMKKDRAAIEAHLKAVNVQLENARKLIEDFLAANSELAQDLANREAALRKAIDAAAPAPATVALP